MGFKKKTFEESFWPLVDKSGVCWEWRGARRGGRRNQYGNWRGNMAHRVSWEVANGRIPDGLIVCHKCDNPICVNPDHLFLGDMKANARDMMKKMRHSSAKLDWEKAAAIRQLRVSGVSVRDLAKRFGVVTSSISQVISCIRWKPEDVGHV